MTETEELEAGSPKWFRLQARAMMTVATDDKEDYFVTVLKHTWALAQYWAAHEAAVERSNEEHRKRRDGFVELLAALSLEGEWVRGAGWDAPGWTDEARRSWFLCELLYGIQHPEDTHRMAAELAVGEDMIPGERIIETVRERLEEARRRGELGWPPGPRGPFPE